MVASPNARKLIKHIQDFESDYGIEPSSIKVNKDGFSISFKKLVLYRYEPLNPQIEYVPIFSADQDLDCEQHARKIAENVSFLKLKSVLVEKENKTLPIPFFNIPIPYWKKSGTRVRGYSDLATQPTVVTITIDSDDVEDPAKHTTVLRTITEAAMITNLPHRRWEDPVVTATATKRESWNPLKWIGFVLSPLVPRSLARYLPRFLKQLARPFPHGNRHAEIQLNTPFCNSGLLANTINIGGSTALLVGVLAACASSDNNTVICCIGDTGNCFEDEKEISFKNTHQKMNSKTNFFLGTKTKLELQPAHRSLNSIKIAEDEVCIETTEKNCDTPGCKA